MSASSSPFGDTMLGLGIGLASVGGALSLVTRRMLRGQDDALLESGPGLLAMFVASPLATLGLMAVAVGLYLRHKASREAKRRGEAPGEISPPPPR